MAHALRAALGEVASALSLHQRISEERREAIGAALNGVLGPRRFQEFGRMPLYHPNAPFILLWSQKAGSTAALRWYLHHVGLLETAEAHGRWIHDYENDVFKARAGYLDDLKDAAAAGAPLVKFVRDPAARALSAFLELNRPKVVRNRLDHWSAYWRKRLLRYVYGASARHDAPLSLLDFLEWVATERAARLNGHIAPQVTRLERSLPRPVRIVKLEGGHAAFQAVERDFGLPVSDERGLRARLKSGHHHEKLAVPTDALDAFAATRFDFAAGAPADIPAFSADTAAAAPRLNAALRSAYGADYDAYSYG